MGGNAFDRLNPAARLSSAELVRLSAYVRTRLASVFQRMAHLRFLDSKTSHGDLDVLCEWDAPAWALEGQAPEDKKEELARGVAELVGATQWRTSGSRVGSLEVHLGVPCAIFDEGSESESESEAYWQVDLLLCLEADFEFRYFSGSYSLLSVILGHAVRGISGRIVLNEDKLLLRHNAISEVPQITVVLTTDAVAMCDWLGLSYARWMQGFATEQEFWEWTIDVRERSPLWFTWAHLARRHQDGYVPLKSRPRVLEMVRYYAWLQTTRFGPAAIDASRGDRAERRLRPDCPRVGVRDTPPSSSATSGTSTPAHSGPAAPLMSSPKQAPDSSPSPSSADPSKPPADPTDRVKYRPRYRDYAAPPAIPIGTLVADMDAARIEDLEAEIIKPARWDLDKAALSALNYWGQRTRYFELVEERREEKRVILRGQLRKVRAREKAARSWTTWVRVRIQWVMGIFKRWRAGNERVKSD